MIDLSDQNTLRLFETKANSALSGGSARSEGALAEIGRYLLAAIAVLAVCASLVAVLEGRSPDGPVLSDSDDAVLVDLPPGIAASTPREAADGPEQPATPATPSAPPDVPPPPPPPVAPEPTVATPPAAAAPTARDETAPTEAQKPVETADPFASDAARHRASQALDRWQRAMMSRLEHAKSLAPTGGLKGRVILAFTIDRHGRLQSCRIAGSSGFDPVDRAALALLKRAAPFPDPPLGASEQTLSFTVPVLFARIP